MNTETLHGAIQRAKEKIKKEYDENKNVEIYYTYSPFEINVRSNIHGPFSFMIHND